MIIRYIYDGSPSTGGYTKFHIFTGENNGNNYIKNIKTKVYFLTGEDMEFTPDGDHVFATGSEQEWEVAQKKMVSWIFTGTLKIDSTTILRVEQ